MNAESPNAGAQGRAALQTRLGHRFQNQALLRQALTHRSAHRSSQPSCGDSNERLEYLGDSVLGLVMAEALFARFHAATEGALTTMRARLVCNQSLAAQARRLNLQACLLLGDGEAKQADHHAHRDSILADAFEAIIGALYLDSDMPTVKQVLLQHFAEPLQQSSPHQHKDDKTRLQEHLQKQGLPLPRYEVVAQQGKPHAPTFTVTCQVSELQASARASGGSRRSAEQKSARKVLALLQPHAEPTCPHD